MVSKNLFVTFLCRVGYLKKVARDVHLRHEKLEIMWFHTDLDVINQSSREKVWSNMGEWLVLLRVNLEAILLCENLKWCEVLLCSKLAIRLFSFSSLSSSMIFLGPTWSFVVLRLLKSSFYSLCFSAGVLTSMEVRV